MWAAIETNKYCVRNNNVFYRFIYNIKIGSKLDQNWINLPMILIG